MIESFRKLYQFKMGGKFESMFLLIINILNLINTKKKENGVLKSTIEKKRRRCNKRVGGL